MIDKQNDGWYEAIAQRHSRRRFLETRIETRKLDQLGKLIAELNGLAEACRVELVPSHDGGIFSGIRGGYGVIKGAPSYIAFIGTPEKENSYEQLGYIGQAVVLEATRLELGTCWVSGTFDAGAATKDLEIERQEQVVAVSPLGYPKDGHTLSEKVMSGLAGSRKRKSLEQMCVGELLGRWPDWAKIAAEAGRLAPSALNRQPWVFRFEADRLSVETDDGGASTSSGGLGKKYSKRLDCGIALRHLAVGAQHSLGKPVSVEVSKHLCIRL